MSTSSFQPDDLYVVLDALVKKCISGVKLSYRLLKTLKDSDSLSEKMGDYGISVARKDPITLWVPSSDIVTYVSVNTGCVFTGRRTAEMSLERYSKTVLFCMSAEHKCSSLFCGDSNSFVKHEVDDLEDVEIAITAGKLEKQPCAKNAYAKIAGDFIHPCMYEPGLGYLVASSSSSGAFEEWKTPVKILDNFHTLFGNALRDLQLDETAGIFSIPRGIAGKLISFRLVVDDLPTGSSLTLKYVDSVEEEVMDFISTHVLKIDSSTTKGPYPKNYLTSPEDVIASVIPRIREICESDDVSMVYFPTTEMYGIYLPGHTMISAELDYFTDTNEYFVMSTTYTLDDLEKLILEDVNDAIPCTEGVSFTPKNVIIPEIVGTDCTRFTNLLRLFAENDRLMCMPCIRTSTRLDKGDFNVFCAVIKDETTQQEWTYVGSWITEDCNDASCEVKWTSFLLPVRRTIGYVMYLLGIVRGLECTGACLDVCNVKTSFRHLQPYPDGPEELGIGTDIHFVCPAESSVFFYKGRIVYVRGDNTIIDFEVTSPTHISCIKYPLEYVERFAPLMNVIITQCFYDEGVSREVACDFKDVVSFVGNDNTLSSIWRVLDLFSNTGVTIFVSKVQCSLDVNNDVVYTFTSEGCNIYAVVTLVSDTNVSVHTTTYPPSPRSPGVIITRRYTDAFLGHVMWYLRQLPSVDVPFQHHFPRAYRHKEYVVDCLMLASDLRTSLETPEELVYLSYDQMFVFTKKDTTSVSFTLRWVGTPENGSLVIAGCIHDNLDTMKEFFDAVVRIIDQKEYEKKHVLSKSEDNSPFLIKGIVDRKTGVKQELTHMWSTVMKDDSLMSINARRHFIGQMSELVVDIHLKDRDPVVVSLFNGDVPHMFVYPAANTQSTRSQLRFSPSSYRRRELERTLGLILSRSCPSTTLPVHVDTIRQCLHERYYTVNKLVKKAAVKEGMTITDVFVTGHQRRDSDIVFELVFTMNSELVCVRMMANGDVIDARGQTSVAEAPREKSRVETLIALLQDDNFQKDVIIKSLCSWCIHLHNLAPFGKGATPDVAKERKVLRRLVPHVLSMTNSQDVVLRENRRHDALCCLMKWTTKHVK